MRQTFLAAFELLRSLQQETINAFTDMLSGKLNELLAPLEWLGQHLEPWRSQIDRQTEAGLVWAWLHRRELHLPTSQILSPAQQPLVTAIWQILVLFHRSSSLAESLHSWMRPYLQVHRGMPDWLLPLLQVVWNHHSFSRGKRSDNTLMQLVGIQDPLSLAQLLDRLAGAPHADLCLI